MAIRHIPIGERNPDAIDTRALPSFTLWFWVKAGIGLTLGVGIASTVATALAWIVGFGLLGTLGALFRPR